MAKLRGVAEKKAQDAAGEYRAAVQAVGAGKTTDPVKLLAVLTAAGRTPEQFSADAEAVAKRIADKAKAAEKPTHVKALAAAVAKLAELDAAFEAAEQAYREARWPVELQHAAATREVDACDQAHQRVASIGMNDPAIVARRNKLLAEQQALVKARFPLDSALSSARTTDTRTQWGDHPSVDRAAARLAAVERTEAAVAANRARYAAIEAAMVALDTEAAAL